MNTPRMPRQPRKSALARASSSKTSSAATHSASPQAATLSGRAIVTIIGSDRVGIIAGIANVIAEANVNILDISQSVIREFFTMIMMVDLSAATISFEALADNLARKGSNLGVKVEIQREEIFKAMHRI
jgi:ACT domain-containing protein